MARVEPLTLETAPPASRQELERQIAEHGRTTNMKRTLARSPVALDALMTWYNLRDAVVPFLGERATMLFAHAISAGTDCLVCSTFFRRILIEWGEDPESLRLDDWERTIVDYGRQLAVDPHGVSDELFSGLADRLRLHRLQPDDQRPPLHAAARVLERRPWLRDERPLGAPRNRRARRPDGAAPETPPARRRRAARSRSASAGRRR